MDPNYNPISILNDYVGSLSFRTIRQEGPEHKPTFVVALNIQGIDFIASGSTKKEAKYYAATTALLTLENELKNDDVYDCFEYEEVEGPYQEETGIKSSNYLNLSILNLNKDENQPKISLIAHFFVFIPQTPQ